MPTRSKTSPAAKAFKAIKAKKIKRYTVAARIKETSAWKAFADYIKARDKYTCITCGKWAEGGAMNAGHFIAATGRLATLFLEENVQAQCAGCNIQGDTTKPIYTLKMIQKYGKEFVEELVRKGNEHHEGFTREDLKEITSKYRSKLQQLTN